MRVKVVDHDEFIKDTASGAVINIDNIALDKAKRRQQAAARKTNEVEELKKDVAEIKSLLKQILDRE